MHYEHPEVEYAGELEFDLSKVNKQHFKETNKEGQRYYIIHYSFVTTLEGNNWKYQMHCPPSTAIGRPAMLNIGVAFAIPDSVV